MPEKDAVAGRELSAVFQRQVAALRPAIRRVTGAFRGFRATVAEIAPKVMKLLRQIQAEDATYTMADFARAFDLSVPQHAKDDDDRGPGYQKHVTYQTLLYMQRYLIALNRPKGQQGRRDPALDRLGRALAMVIPIIENPDVLWRGIQKNFGLTDRSLSILQSHVAKTKPLVDLTGLVKPVHITDKNIVIMQPLAAARGGRDVLAQIRKAGQQVRKAG